MPVPNRSLLCGLSYQWTSFLSLTILTASLLASSAASAQDAGVRENSSGQCTVRIVANDVVVYDLDRREEAFHVLPQGIIPQASQWPYFAWSDTPLGVVATKDGSGYLFFGSDGGCHKDCTSTTPRSGSITRSVGTLDHPLGEPANDPNPPVTEFLLPTSTNLPDYIDYVGGGPVYRVPDGELGAGNLLIVYHAERPANPFWSWLGLAKSTDEGLTWEDLGLIIGGTHAYTSQGVLDIGDGGLVPYYDPVTAQKYFYIYFGEGCGLNSTTRCPDFTYLSVARAPYEKVLQTAFLDANSSKPAPLTGMFLKYYKGQWNQSGMDGRASELFPGVTGETDGDPEMAWSAYRNRFVAIMDNGQDIAYGESVDGIHWPPMQVILASSGVPVYGYANAVGLGADPGILGETFYSYYTAMPLGVAWQPATLNRLTITTAATVTSIVPTSVDAPGAAFTLTVNGDSFVSNSKVMWNGAPLTTTYVNANQLTVLIPASNTARAGNITINVWNPPPCGGVSNGKVFVIQSPQN